VDRSVPVNDPAQELQYIQSSAWQYARISSAPRVTDVTLGPFGEPSTALPFQGSVGADAWNDRGKWVKTFAYEKAVFHAQRNVMYEVGGMIARKRTGFAQAQGVQVSQGQSTTLSGDDVLAQDAAGNVHVPTGATPIKLDTASGNIYRTLWDRSTGEGLEEVVALPVNGFWDHTDGFRSTHLPQGQFKPIEFLRAFRTYTVSPSDLVLIKEDVYGA
jgi:hypothetical protein